jgi:hypothetical protein
VLRLGRVEQRVGPVVEQCAHHRLGHALGRPFRRLLPGQLARLDAAVEQLAQHGQLLAEGQPNCPTRAVPERVPDAGGARHRRRRAAGATVLGAVLDGMIAAHPEHCAERT